MARERFQRRRGVVPCKLRRGCGVNWWGEEHAVDYWTRRAKEWEEGKVKGDDEGGWMLVVVVWVNGR